MKPSITLLVSCILLIAFTSLNSKARGKLSIDSGRKGICNFLKLPNPPDAVFATEDYTALGAIKELKDRNIKIPGEFGVIGFCNDLFGEHITPGLSTVDQQTFIMGQEAFKLIFNMIKTKDFKHVKNVIIEPIPVIRESSLKNVKKK